MRKTLYMLKKNAFISKSCFSYQFYQLNYYYFRYSFSVFVSVFKHRNDLDPVALSAETNVSVIF